MQCPVETLPCPPPIRRAGFPTREGNYSKKIINMKKIQEQLKRLKNEDVLQARPAWVLENKHLLMSQIAKTTLEASAKKENWNIAESWKRFSHIYQMFVPTNINKAFRPILTAVMALVITSGGWIASAYAEPGDFMWSTKVALNSVVEQGQLALTPEEKKTSIKLDFATKRAHILKQVSDSNIQNKDTKNKLLKETSADLQNKLNVVSESLQNVDPKDAVNLVKEVSLKTKGISNTLKDVATQTDDKNLSKDLSQQAVDTSKQSLQMVEVVLEKKVEANSEVSDEEKLIIKEHISDVVTEIKEDAEKVKEQSTQLKDQDVIDSKDIDVSKDVVKSLVATSSTAKNSLTANTINEIVSSTSSNLTEPISNLDLVSKVDQVVKTVSEENNDVTKLADDNILEAVKKTIELKTTVNNVSREVSNTLVTQATTKVIVPTTIITTTSTIKTSVSSTLK